MAYYNNYFPQGYYAGANMPLQGPQMPANAQQAQNNQITWVQGEAAAKAFPVGAGQAVLLMDSESTVFYIKSTDQSGMPQPLRVFDYTERTAQQHSGTPTKTPDEYVTRAEFDEFKKTITGAGGEG